MKTATSSKPCPPLASRASSLHTALTASLLIVPILFTTPVGAVQFSVTNLGTLWGSASSARGINAAGQVVGYADTSGNAASHAFLWQPGSMQDLGTLGGTDSFATGINIAGQVVGISQTGSSEYHAFLWQSGSMQDLGTLGGISSGASGINAAGQVVGAAATSGGANHAYLWQFGNMQDLGTLGGANSQANGINAAGQVVGFAETSDAAYHAFLRGAQGDMIDLNSLLIAGSGATVTDANGINDLGQIAGSATIGGQTRAVLLTPGGSLTWLGSGAGGSFSDGANWELGFSPNKFLDAVIGLRAARPSTQASTPLLRV